MSIKSTIAALAASPLLLSGAAFAGPYVNVESNLGYPDGEYSSATTDLHIGYEGSLSETADFYAQVGPAFVHTDSTDDTEGEISGKVGVNVAVNESLGVYGELAGISGEASNDDIIDWTGKIGAKFTF
tara:strand:- start:221 stop:604 length:384 start_codon:yes stop_codon:yes gene_type:complete